MRDTMGKLVLFVGGYNGANDALTQALLAPGLDMCRVETRELTEAMLKTLRVEAAIFAFDVPTTDVLAIAEGLRPRPGRPRLFAILARGAMNREALVQAGIACLDAWADTRDLRIRVHDSLGLPPEERSAR